MDSGAASPPSGSTASPVVPGDAGAPPAAARPTGLFSEPGVVQRVSCAVFAWAVTIAPAAFSRAGGWPERALSVAALAAGVAGPVFMPTKKRIGRQLGITLFLALATVVWLLTSSALDPSRLDTVRAGIGAIAWGVYAFSWGEPWRFRTEAPQDDAGGVLRARTTLPSGAVAVASLGVLASLGLLVLGWSVRDPSRALLAQAASIGLSVAIVSAAAQVAIARAKGRRQLHTGLPREALRAIFALLFVALVGAFALIWRS
ncbi:MAG: hypothetical protein HOV80_29460 [Polyangiaceae bacterium]|nr:hypothetical protein [Polyangiaceae bacterium]